MDIYYFTGTWAICIVSSVILSAWTISRRLRHNSARHHGVGPTLLATAACGLPSVGLGIFYRVFFFGGSNVAQFAGPDGMALWQLWFHAWGWLGLGGPFSVLLAIAALIWSIRRRCGWQAWLAAVLAGVAACLTTMAAFQNQPDA